MATNPFQRFARGAASGPPTATPVGSKIEAPSDCCADVKRSSESLPTVRKRKRTETTPPSPTAMASVKHEELPDEDAGSNTDHVTANERRIRLLQQLVDARRDGPDAAIDVYGTQACVFRPATTAPATQRFQLLVAALLSSQTQDPITYAAMQRLHTLLLADDDKTNEGLTIDKVRAASVERLEELLVPVGFYRRKAQQLKQVAETLHETHHDDIPRTLDGLMELAGIGPKIARVILLLAWDDIDAGLIVDTHVHRLAQRLEWVPPDGTKTPEQTRAALEEWVPRNYWRDFSRNVVGFGQNVCVAVHPKCIDCPLAPSCPSAFTYHHPSKQHKKKRASLLAYEV